MTGTGRLLRWPLALLLASLATAVLAQEPEQLVRDTAGRILDALNQRSAEFADNPAAVEDLVRRDLMPVLDIRYSARLILGRTGRGASDAQIDAFADAMSEVLIKRYASGLLEYRQREQLEVLPVRGELNERQTRVRTRVRTPNGQFIPVDYIFRKSEAGWRAFDVIVEGISYVTTYRNQIMPQVEASGIDAVTERLVRGELSLDSSG